MLLQTFAVQDPGRLAVGEAGIEVPEETADKESAESWRYSVQRAAMEFSAGVTRR